MSDLSTDAESLAAFARSGCAAAVETLVKRYLDLVHSTARRLVFDDHLAEDVTQATFVVMLKKAGHIDARTLPGWLVNTTRLAAMEAMRARRTRNRHESRAAETRLEAQNSSDDPSTEEMLPMLDDALAHLNEADRTAVVLRFLQGRTFIEVGNAMGCSEEAARKRVGRAVEKLRSIFMRQGLTPSVGGLMIVLATQQSHSAPGGMLEATVSAAKSTTGGSTGGAAIAESLMRTTVAISAKSAIFVLISICTIAGAMVGFHAWTASRSRSMVVAVSRSTLPPVPPRLKAILSPVPLPPRAPFDSVSVNDPGLAAMPYLKGWPRALPGSIAATPVVADLAGDGRLAIVVPCLQRNQVATVHPSPVTIPLLFAFYPDGSTVPGWPIALGESGNSQLMSRRLWFVSPAVVRRPSGRDAIIAVGPARNVMVLNDDRDAPADPAACWLSPVARGSRGEVALEVDPSQSSHASQFPWDGKPLPPTMQPDGVFRIPGAIRRDSGLGQHAPSLADLDGDGLAESIVAAPQSGEIVAFYDHARHKAATTAATKNREVIATVPGDITGVSVVSLGDDPRVTDLFAGTYWIRRFPDGSTQIKNMLPANAMTDWIQPSIVDLLGNKEAEVIFGLSDGRLFVYQTGLAYHADRMQWPTEYGDFQHTGIWKSRPQIIDIH